MTQKIEETSGIDCSAQLPVVAYHVKYRAGEFLDWSNKWGSDADTKGLSYTADAQALLAELREELACAEQWRDLALQFDRHRMNAMALIKAVAAGKAGAPEYAAFAAVPPIPGHAITAEIAEKDARIAELERQAVMARIQQGA